MAERLLATRISARQDALDRARWPEETLVLRLADDDAIVLPARHVDVDDPDAIVEEDGGFAGQWVDDLDQLAAVCAWPLPPESERPALVQGAVAGLPARVWVEPDRALVIVPAPLAHELEERLDGQERRAA